MTPMRLESKDDEDDFEGVTEANEVDGMIADEAAVRVNAYQELIGKV